jgi:hypothetical protein
MPKAPFLYDTVLSYNGSITGSANIIGGSASIYAKLSIDPFPYDVELFREVTDFSTSLPLAGLDSVLQSVTTSEIIMH